MSLESNLVPHSPGYIALRVYLRARARDYSESIAPKTATNARRQLNQAFDAGVSATVEMLRTLDPPDSTLLLGAMSALLAENTTDGFELIRRYLEQIGVDHSEYSERIGGSGGAPGVRTASVRGAEAPGEGTGRVAPTVRETERARFGLREGTGEATVDGLTMREMYDDSEVCYPAPCDIDGRELRLTDRVIWTEKSGWGPGTLHFLSRDSKRAKVMFDDFPEYNENIPTSELRMLDGSV